MVDFSATASRVYGMIANPQATLAFNSQPVPSWRIVAKEHVLPIVIAATVVHGFLIWMLQPVYEAAYRAAGLDMPESGDLLLDSLLRAVFQFAGIAVWAGVVGFFAGALGGRKDYNAAYVLVALALTPHMVSTAFLPIPAIGQLLWLGTFIYAMVGLYKGAPALVGIPSENRAKHLVLSLVSMLMIGIVLALVFGPLLTRPNGTLG
jgi:hypothetical protein